MYKIDFELDGLGLGLGVWLSDKICISFTNVDVIFYCLQNFATIRKNMPQCKSCQKMKFPFVAVLMINTTNISWFYKRLDKFIQ